MVRDVLADILKRQKTKDWETDEQRRLQPLPLQPAEENNTSAAAIKAELVTHVSSFTSESFPCGISSRFGQKK